MRWNPSPGFADELCRTGNPPSAAAPNAGLLIDIWHYYNGGGRPEHLVDLPAAGITGVQLNDGRLVHDDFLQHARAERELPGDGEPDVVGLVRAVQRAGFTGPYCVESNPPEFRKLPVTEAARRAADAASRVLRAAGTPVSWTISTRRPVADRRPPGRAAPGPGPGEA